MLDLDNPNAPMLLASGKTFDPTDLSTFRPDILDILHALPRIQRFGGHTRKPFSVGQHTLHVADLVRENHPQFVLEALLHDASEAYLGDIPKPLKRALPDYRRLEGQVQAVIGWTFKLNPEADGIIKRADQEAFEVEWSWHQSALVTPPPYQGLDVRAALRTEIFTAMEARRG